VTEVRDTLLYVPKPLHETVTLQDLEIGEKAVMNDSLFEEGFAKPVFCPISAFS